MSSTNLHNNHIVVVDVIIHQALRKPGIEHVCNNGFVCHYLLIFYFTSLGF
uniref:Uncharacterized protein n=1 Tax=Octopus bimaculoides TaxID=37653 RepID=A0A0L8IA35_OCTBM